MVLSSARVSPGRSRRVSFASSASVWTSPAAWLQRRHRHFAEMLGSFQAATDAGALSFLGRLWAYLSLGATGIITEEATPLLGGLAARSRNLELGAVGLWIAGGTWLAGLG